MDNMDNKPYSQMTVGLVYTVQAVFIAFITHDLQYHHVIIALKNIIIYFNSYVNNIGTYLCNWRRKIILNLFKILTQLPEIFMLLIIINYQCKRL